jgi:hypothetical protein
MAENEMSDDANTVLLVCFDTQDESIKLAIIFTAE